ncbi:hypothetical protein F442_22817 [Phytophthora nicotianae P10297]|uniref:AB hydrolase-1 domain-containing protein n=1 Tax=Phytophthora nicotianae P10297 TaxID=1317064 RepID=W2XZT5_PHYNI|nr:hypothetical protein F442_22817 [Phytophthora nicotianae P10297]
MPVSTPLVVATAFAILILVVAARPLNNSVKPVELDWFKSALSTVPSLRLHATLNDKNVKIHGHSIFDVFLNPIVSSNNTSIHYDGSSTFIQDDTKFTYVFENGTSYMVESHVSGNASSTWQTLHCLPSIIPFKCIVPALNNVTSIPSASVGGETIKCPKGSLFQTVFSGVEFVLCASSASGFTAYGLDITMTVEYLATTIHHTLPAFSSDISMCPVVGYPTPVTPVAIALLTGRPLPSPSSRKLKAAAPVAIEADSCECMSTPRPCIFFHGLGNPIEKSELQDTPKLTKEKFGDIGDHAPCCTTVKYAVINTVDVGWRNDSLQQKFCDFALSMSETSDLATRTISDTIVVTHSMGGLALASAIANGKCKLTASTSWVSMSAPMRGSMAGDVLQDICDGKFTKAVAGLMDLLGQCPTTIAKQSIYYQNGKYSTPELNAAYLAAQEAYRSNVHAALCSKSYYGVLSKFSPSCLVGGTVIPHKSDENDALVEFQSCLGGLDPDWFGNNYRDRFYAAKLNHADTAFLTHDSFFRDSQKPFKWFECLL